MLQEQWGSRPNKHKTPQRAGAVLGNETTHLLNIPPFPTLLLIWPTVFPMYSFPLPTVVRRSLPGWRFLYSNASGTSNSPLHTRVYRGIHGRGQDGRGLPSPYPFKGLLKNTTCVTSSNVSLPTMTKVREKRLTSRTLCHRTNTKRSVTHMPIQCLGPRPGQCFNGPTQLWNTIVKRVRVYPNVITVQPRKTPTLQRTGISRFGLRTLPPSGVTK